MPMELVFELQLEGQLDQPRLDRLRKLLNLTPRGRLTDLDDANFGQQALRAEPDSPVQLTLWRRDGSARWAVRLTFAGPPPAAELVASTRGQVVAAAAAVGLTADPATAPPPPARLPGQRALSGRMTGRRTGAGRPDAGPWAAIGQLEVEPLHALQEALDLHLEFGGLSGTEYGWRYLAWAPPDRSILLQLLDDPSTGTEVALLFDRQPPSAEMVAGCRRELTAAAARAGLGLQLVPE